jgi:hypothetical protein
MIHAFFLINTKGKVRLVKIFNPNFTNQRQLLDLINKEIVGYEKLTKGNFFDLDHEAYDGYRVVFR